MPRPPRRNEEKARHYQVGILMRTYRESHPDGQGGRGISQTELLRLMGSINPYYGLISSHVAVSKWESEDTPPTKERIETFGKALGLSEDEVKGIAILAGIDEEPQETRTLSCSHCGEKTVAERVRANPGETGAELYTNIATRTRKCVSCGHTAKSTERWSLDPTELENDKVGRILSQIAGANVRILQALTEANHLPNIDRNEGDTGGIQPPRR